MSSIKIEFRITDPVDDAVAKPQLSALLICPKNESKLQIYSFSKPIARDTDRLPIV
jgi:hypothetical protein